MKHNHLLYLFAVILLAATALAGCEKAFKVKSITVHPAELVANPNDTIQLSFALEYEGGNYDDANLISPLWTSSDDNIVEVNSLGKIVAKSIGSSDITVSCGGAESKCRVTVTEKITDKAKKSN